MCSPAVNCSNFYLINHLKGKILIKMEKKIATLFVVLTSQQFGFRGLLYDICQFHPDTYFNLNAVFAFRAIIAHG